MSTLFIGLGAMGRPMVRQLAAATEVIVYDLDTDASSTIAHELEILALESLDTIPPGVDSVILMVPSSRVVEHLLEGDGGLLEKLSEGDLVVDMSSSEPASSQRLAGMALRRGIAYVDAPVSGGVAKATTGELAIMVGGLAEDVSRALPLLESMGRDIHHVGGPGAGDVAKALNNLLSATNIAAVAEVLTAASRFGLSPEAMLRVINSSTGRSQASEVKFPAYVLSGTFDSGFGMDLMLKDLAIAATLTSEAGLDAPVTTSARTVANTARSLAGTPADHTEIIRYYESTSGELIRAEDPSTP